MIPELEKIAIYGTTVIFLLVVVLIYLRKLKKESSKSDHKIKIAKEEGLFEPVSLHPVVDVNSCIKSGACILACPEKERGEYLLKHGLYSKDIEAWKKEMIDGFKSSKKISKLEKKIYMKLEK